MRQTTSKPFSQSTILIVICFACLFITLACTTWRPAISRQLNAWKLLPEPEKLTELYFTKPNNLPTTYVAGSSQQVNFTVHNLEYQTMTYKYAIVEQNQNDTQHQTLAANSFTLEQGQYQSVSFTGSLVDMGKNARVVVELPTTDESVDYLITRSNQ